MLARAAKVRYLLTLFIMTLSIGPVYAFDCPWTALTGGLQYNMVVEGSLYVDGQKVTSGYCVGAFGPGGSGDCRAVDTSGSYYLTVRGSTNGETITFQVFENATGLIFDVNETVTFLSEGDLQ